MLRFQTYASSARLLSGHHEVRARQCEVQYGNIFRHMPTSGGTSHYALGNTDAEHERLIRQAMILAPLTERFFRQAGIGPGQRVLDLGSGVGDVAMLAARLVGPSGEVVGVERNTRSIVRARARVAEAGLNNVIFTQSDVRQLPVDKPFDAVIGRFILQFLPEPVIALQSISQLVRPGGIVAFHEPCWSAILPMAAHLPLWFACASLIREFLNVPVGTQRWALPSAVPFSRRACPRQLSRWKFPWEIIPQPRSGSTIFFAPCCRRCSNSIFPLRAWATWTLSGKEFNPKSKARKIPFRVWHSSEPGPTGRQTLRLRSRVILPERSFRENNASAAQTNRETPVSAGGAARASASRLRLPLS